MPTTTQVEATLQINAIGARSDFAGSTVGIDDLSAEEIRFDQKIFEAGVLEPTNAFEVVAGAGGTMDIVVGSGSAKVDYAYVSGDTVGQGNYLVRLDDVTKTITLAAPDASLDRTDEIWLVVLDDVYDGSTKALPVFGIREGDVGGGAPGPDAGWEAALKLASIVIPGGSSDITEATITDSRVNAKMVVPAIEATDGTFNGVDVALHAHTGAAGQGGDVDAGDLLNLKAAVDAANVDADTLDGLHSSDFTGVAHAGAGGGVHADATTGSDGFMSAADKSKLNGIESGATADQTAAQILALIKTVDGSGSGLDADLLDGTSSSGFANASHSHTEGDLPNASTGGQGVVQLVDAVGTSLTKAPTQNLARVIHDEALDKVPQTGGIFTGNVDFNQGLDIPGSGTLDQFWPGLRRINDPNWGSVRLEGDNGYRMYFHSSTKYIKSNDKIIPYEDSLSALSKLDPRTYDTEEGKRAIGFFAENVREAEPLTAPEPRETERGPDEVPSYGFDGIIAHLVNGVNYLVKENADLKQRVSTLEDKVEALEA